MSQERFKWLREIVSEVIATDYESIVDKIKEETQEETTNLIHIAQSVGMKLFI